MRLQLAAAIVCAARLAHADDALATDPGDGQVTGSLALYADDDRTTVVTSVVDGRVRLPQPVVVGAHALVDAVSSASVDVVSAATPRFSENRVELGTTVAAHALGFDETAGYTHSQENDWQSHAVELGLARELAHKNAKLSLGYGFTRNHVGRAGDPTFERMLDVHGAQLGIAQVIDRKTLATLAYTLAYASGYQSSPYRYIMTPGGVSAPETTPASRVRHALTARVLHTFGSATTVDASYRLYLDDWGILSHTAEATLTQELNATRELELRIRIRGYRQQHAAFYREQYAMPMQYMTADRELSTFWDAAGGIRLGWFGERWEIDAKLDGIYYRFADYARLAGRVALVTGAGVTWKW